METDDSEMAGERPAYQLTLDAGMDLDAFIDKKLAELDFGSLIEKSTDALDLKLKPQERKTREVNQLFANCEEQLKQLCEIYDEDMEIDGAHDSDSDDDVQFVQAGFEPQFARRPGPTQARYVVRDGRRMMVPQGQSLPPAGVSSEVGSHQVMRPNTAMYAPPPQTADLVVGMKLFGKKFNDIWYKGTLTEIVNKDKAKHEWRYRVKFDSKGMKSLPGKLVSFADCPGNALPVGSRVIAYYRDEDGTNMSSHYAGIVAESPSARNAQRYLIFFDDGYAQYCTSKEIHKVCEQSRNVWEDIHPDSQEFIKSYLKQYPERPMVRLQKGQVIKTEWNGEWWTARVDVADASLVKMFFEADQRVEWIYRGSTRLEPLYTELANAEKSVGGKAHRKHSLQMKHRQKPFVEYLRGTESDYTKVTKPPLHKQQIKTPQGLQRHNSAEIKKRSVAKKSTGKGNETVVEKSTFQANSGGRLSGGREPVNRLSTDYYAPWNDDESLGHRVDIKGTLPLVQRRQFVPHVCRRTCLKDDDPKKHLGRNPLIIPMLCGWDRQIAKQKNVAKRAVFYRAPCGRRFRSLDEVLRYLLITASQFTIDFFCFEVFLHTHTEFVPIKTFCDIKDLSYGKETVVISCVNGIDRQYPDYVEYSNKRIPAKGVVLNLAKEFLVGCQCKPGQCGDPKFCSCARLTMQARAALPKYIQPECTSYQHRRLRENIISGIYECNSNCRCDHRCPNRVAQNGLQLRLQVFKTEKRGWGLRCLDDIPAGGFICVYAGQLLTEQGANEDGQQYGDEYLAELDYIEVVERTKDGYESEVTDVEVDEEPPEEEGKSKEEDEDDMDEADDDYNNRNDSDSTYSGEKYVNTTKITGTGNRKSSRRRSKKDNDGTPDDSGSTKIIIKRDTDQDKSWSVKVKSSESKTKEWVDSIPDPPVSLDAIVISDDDDSRGSKTGDKSKSKKEGDVKKEKAGQEEVKGIFGGSSNAADYQIDLQRKPLRVPRIRDRGANQMSPGGSVDEDNSRDSLAKKSKDGDENSDSKDGMDQAAEGEGKKSRFRNLPDPRNQQVIPAVRGGGKVSKEIAIQPEKPPENISDKKKEKKKEDKVSPIEDQDNERDSRRFFNEEFCYVMDAKSMGNIGRYLNHSCSPNVFVQNVFVDTHDLRFPWVAFFAAQYIRAGTELTWDYNYEVGSVHGKVLYCYCGAADCRGRLL